MTSDASVDVRGPSFTLLERAYPSWGAQPAFTVGFALYLDPVDPSSPSTFLTIQFDETGFTWMLQLAESGSILHEYRAGEGGSVDTDFPVDLSKLYAGWHAVVFHFGSGGGPGPVQPLDAYYDNFFIDGP